jgi:hypothetical protein
MHSEDVKETLRLILFPEMRHLTSGVNSVCQVRTRCAQCAQYSVHSVCTVCSECAQCAQCASIVLSVHNVHKNELRDQVCMIFFGF